MLEKQQEARVVVLGIADVKRPVWRPIICNVTHRRLAACRQSLFQATTEVSFTMSTRTARSRLPNNQKAQVANHRCPPAKARGTTVPLSIDLSSGPSVPPSTARASATASCQSSNWRMQILIASLGEAASMKKAAAYSAYLSARCRPFG